MRKKTEAFRLADAIERYNTVGYLQAISEDCGKKLAELRRLESVNDEMLRYLPVLERAEADSKIWAQLTDGLGIETLSGYRAAIAKATGETK